MYRILIDNGKKVPAAISAFSNNNEYIMSESLNSFADFELSRYSRMICSYEEENRPCSLIGLVSSGEGILKNAKEESCLQKSSLIFVCRESIDIQATSEILHICCIVVKGPIEEFCFDLLFGTPNNKRQCCINNNNRIRDFFSELQQHSAEAKEQKLPPAESSRHIREIREATNILHILQYIISGVSEDSNEHIDSPEAINDCKYYISVNFDKPLRLDELAKKYSYSKYHFQRVFKKYTKCTPHEFLTNIRIKNAIEMLKNNNTTQEICEKIGISSVCHFINLFKKHTGMTPKEYKKKFL